LTHAVTVREAAQDQPKASAPRLLVCIPTYDERDNAERLCAEILALALPCKILFLDDASPDGTGEVLDRIADGDDNVKVIHRQAKLGIGSAHRDGIEYAYANGYECLVTMDCDFTHSPADIGRLLEASEGYDLVVGSRYQRLDSLASWNRVRRALTLLAHLLTTRLLHIPGDASGALRLYDLRRIPPRALGCVRSTGYSFFFESLFLLTRSGFSIAEISIALPARTRGHSKLTVWEGLKSGVFLFQLWLASLVHPARLRMPTAHTPN
jgi:dolichol-phosphate mannosyltransferase